MGLLLSSSRQSYAQIADAAGLRLASWTIGCNFRLESLPASGETFVLIAKGGLDTTTKACFYLAYRNNSGTLQFLAGFMDDTSPGVARTVTANVDLVAGRWYTAIAGFDDATQEIDIYYAERGTAVSETRVSSLTTGHNSTLGGYHTDTAAATYPVRIGAGSTSAGLAQNFANVTIDEAFIYSALIAKATLEGRLGQRLVGTETSLIGYWRFDEGTGSTAYDRDSGTGRNATLKNRPTWSDAPVDLWYVAATAPAALLGYESGTLRRAATITASEENASYPASNLRSPLQARTWRTSNATGAKTLVVDFGAAIPIWAIEIENHNLSSGAVVLGQLHSADSWAGPDVSETITFHPGRMLLVFTYPYQYRYGRISITDANATGGYIEAGSIHFWCCWNMPRGIVAETHSVTDMSSTQITPHGHYIDRSVGRVRDVSLSLGTMYRSEAFEADRIMSRMGGGGPVLVLADIHRNLYGASTYGVVAQPFGMTPGEPSWTLADMTGLQVVEDIA